MAIVNGTANDDVLFIDSGKSNDTLLGLAGNDYLDALAGRGNNTLRGGDGNDELYAYTNDRLEGEAGKDTLTSDGNGSNTLVGGDGDDIIYADRSDVVLGDAGDDKIYGGQGGNAITSGTGKDVIWIANADVPTTPNTITDFDRLNDTLRINLAGVTNFSDLTIAKSGTDATISFGTQQLALLKNTAPGSLNSNTVAVNPTAPNNAGSNVTSYDFTNLPKLGTTSKGQDIFLGGFSGLYFQGIAANGNLKFITHTDRGPNGEPTGANRPFFLPNFQPEIVSFELNQTSGEINITKRTGLFRADGKTPLTGLPNLQAGANGLAYTDEIGVDLDGKVLANDPLGADVEGIVIGSDGNYWMVDEYRPAIYQFDVNGKLLDRFIPKGTATAPTTDFPAGTFGTEVFPEVYAQRRSNRGFEAVAIEGTKLYAFMQSPIDNPDNAADTASRATRTVRILEFDTATKAVTGEYLYLLDDITASGNAKTDKLGDAVSLGGGKFAVVERDDLATTASNKLIYQIDLAAATNINNPANFSLPAGKTIEQLTPAELTTAKITPVSKSLIANAAQLGYTGVEKLEGLALVAPNTLALINDNDFNVAPGSKVPEKLGLLELSKDLPVTGIISTKILTATDSADLLLGIKESNTRIIGDRRNNIIDASIAAGRNQIYAGDGADELYAYQNDRLFGEGGNDILDATDGTSGNELNGGTGEDKLFAGTNDRLFGGDGNDTLFAGLGGNTLTGGNGKDTFILAAASLPTQVNIITDYQAGTDTLQIFGIPGIGNDITKLTATRQGSDTLLKAGTVDVALLKGIQATTITDVLNPEPTSTSPTPTAPGSTSVPPILPSSGINNNVVVLQAIAKGVSSNAAIKVIANSTNDSYQVLINNQEMYLNAPAPVAATPTIPIGAKSQNLSLGGILDLSEYTGKTLKADIALSGDSSSNNNLAFYLVEDASSGNIRLADGKTILKPGDANYAIEAIKSAVLKVGKTDTQSNLDLVGGKVYAPILVSQGSLTDFVNLNPTNSGGENAIHAYFNYLGANPDKVDHFRLLGNNTFGAEDFYGGGDRDFNDLIVDIKIKTV